MTINMYKVDFNIPPMEVEAENEDQALKDGLKALKEHISWYDANDGVATLTRVIED